MKALIINYHFIQFVFLIDFSVLELNFSLIILFVINQHFFTLNILFCSFLKQIYQSLTYLYIIENTLLIYLSLNLITDFFHHFLKLYIHIHLF